ncbi:MAG: NAD(P)/FAD-dependent oxidoreductase [Proteobacteria bacterium]|nr:NAD(P)/FAD-dependent oxidoreductase [Pseudomonadota bacterium]
MTDRRVDVVVIGAGMGGLIAASLLAKSGLNVQVLEMDSRPGGYLAGFQRKKFLFDTAIHWLNQCGPGGGVRRILDFVGPGAPATPPLRKIRRYRSETLDYLLTENPDELRDRLISDHPDQAGAITDFFAAARTIGDAFETMTDHMRASETMTFREKGRRGRYMAPVGMRFLKYVKHSTEDGFTKLFPSPALLEMFCSEERLIGCLTQVGWAYTGDYQVPPHGGSQEFAHFLVRALEAFGGAISYRSRVTEIELDGGAVAGVRYREGRTRFTDHAIACKYVLAACDLDAVYDGMLPAGTIDPKLLERLRAADVYHSSVTVSLALDVPPEELGFTEELVFLTRDGIGRLDHNNGDPEQAGISILVPSLRDPSMAPSGTGTMTLMVSAKVDYGDRWKTGPNDERGPGYKAFKKAFADVLIRRVEEALAPGLSERILICDIATPITHLRYTGNRDGSIMAARPSRANMKNKVAGYTTPVKRLYVAGHCAELGGGVPIATRAGSNAALLVLKEEKPEVFRIVADVMDGTRDPTDPIPDWMGSL